MTTFPFNPKAVDWECMLSEAEAIMAAGKGMQDLIDSIIRNEVGRDHGRRGTRSMRERVGDTVIGALGEMAFSRCTGQPWPLAKDPTRRLADVGGFELKSTSNPNAAIRLSDQEAARKQDRVFILALGFWPRWKILGWAYGHEVRDRGTWRDDLPDPCWQLWAEDLNPMQDLPV